MFFHTEPVMPRMTRIRSVADTMMYLVEGDDRALLVDTGYGVGNLREFVGTLTDKPVVVVLTHGHVDHALGARGFEEVYLNPLDREVYLAHSQQEVQRAYPFSYPDDIWGAFAKPSEADWNQPLPFERFLPMHVGDVFELGGVSAAIMEGAGHTPGCVTILFPELRALLLGDACNEFTFLFESYCSPIAEYRAMLARLRDNVDGAYDRALFLHRAGEGPTDLISSVIDVCDDVLAGRSDAIEFHSLIGNGLIAKRMNFPTGGRCDGGIGNVVYDPAKMTARHTDKK